MRSVSLVPNQRLSCCSRFGLRDTPSRAEPSSKSVTSAQTSSLGSKTTQRRFVANVDAERARVAGRHQASRRIPYRRRDSWI